MSQKNTVGSAVLMGRFAMVDCAASNGGYADTAVALLASQEWRLAEIDSAFGSSGGSKKGTVCVNWPG
jgi:hypothetical protein